MNYNSKQMTFIIDSLTNGGAERVVSILASACAKAGAKVRLILLWDAEKTYSVSSDVEVVQLPNRNSRFRAFLRILDLRKALKEKETETLFPFLPKVTVYTFLANIGLKNKVVASERIDPGIRPQKWFSRDGIIVFFLRKLKLFGLADWMVFQTPDAQKWYPEFIQKKSCIIPNPLDTDNLPERYDGEREDRIVAAGRFTKEKNFPMLLNAFAEFHKSFPQYELWLYGDGELREEYSLLCRNLEISEFVHMPGFVPDLHEQIYRAKMYVSTSNHEGISNSMLEALALGIPAIVTDCPAGGARMFVKNDKNGLLIHMESKEELLQAMVRIATDENYAASLSKEATKIRRELDAKTICEKWMSIM